MVASSARSVLSGVIAGAGAWAAHTLSGGEVTPLAGLLALTLSVALGPLLLAPAPGRSTVPGVDPLRAAALMLLAQVVWHLVFMVSGPGHGATAPPAPWAAPPGRHRHDQRRRPTPAHARRPPPRRRGRDSRSGRARPVAGQGCRSPRSHAAAPPPGAVVAPGHPAHAGPGDDRGPDSSRERALPRGARPARPSGRHRVSPPRLTDAPAPPAHASASGGSPACPHRCRGARPCREETPHEQEEVPQDEPEPLRGRPQGRGDDEGPAGEGPTAHRPDPGRDRRRRRRRGDRRDDRGPVLPGRRRAGRHSLRRRRPGRAGPRQPRRPGHRPGRRGLPVPGLPGLRGGHRRPAVVVRRGRRRQRGLPRHRVPGPGLVDGLLQPRPQRLGVRHGGGPGRVAAVPPQPLRAAAAGGRGGPQRRPARSTSPRPPARPRTPYAPASRTRRTPTGSTRPPSRPATTA